MATLNTNQTQLARISRNRNLADALAQMSMQTQPLGHPYQVLAQLAQAWAGVKGNQAARSIEKRAAKQEQEALAKALGPQYSDIVTASPAQQSPVQQQQQLWQGESLPNSPIPSEAPMEFNQLQQVMTSPGLPQRQIDMLMSLDPASRNQAMGAFVQQQMMAEAGITPQQLKQQYQPPVDEYAQVGKFDVNMPGMPKMEGVPVYRVKGEATQGVFMGDQFIPVDANQLTEIQRQTTVTPGEIGKIKDTVVEGAVALNQIARLENLIMMPNTSLDAGSTVGGLRNLAESFKASLGALGQTFTVMYRGKEQTDFGQLTERSSYEGYDMNNVTKQDRMKYSEAQMQENLSAWDELQAQDAAYQQIAIALAYTLARIADPGGRLSEMDVLNQVRSLQLSSPSVNRRMSALHEAKVTFAETLYQRVNMYNMNVGDDGTPINIDPALWENINNLRGMQNPWHGPRRDPNAIGALEQKYGAAFLLVRDMAKGLSDQQKRELEAANNFPIYSLDNQ